MKATVETLTPTRVKLSVEVPFDELAPAVDGAYRKVGRQVRIQGFRPGKVPPRILDQRVGRAAILDEALQDAIPRFYAAAVDDQNVAVVGQPDLHLDSFADGAPLIFTATVDVRPEVVLPPYDGIAVTVDDATVSDAEVDRQLAALADRDATLEAVDRPAQVGDYVLLDIRATGPDGALIPGSEAKGLSYEVGSDGLVPGLDRAIVGLAAGGGRTFDAEISYGELSGTSATFETTVQAVRVKHAPTLDDEFAKTASEYDTLAELRTDVAGRLITLREFEQRGQVRDRVRDALLTRVDVALPEGMVDAELDWTVRRYAELTGDQPDRDKLRPAAEHAVKSQLVLDAIAAKEDLAVSEVELTEQVVLRAARLGVSADALVQRYVEEGRVPELMAEILRAKALALVIGTASVTDASGRPVNVGGDDDAAADADADAAADAEADQTGPGAP